LNHEKKSGGLSQKDKAPKIYMERIGGMEKIASWEIFEDITTKLRHILPPITHHS
jgi:hypothetical protein